MFSGLCLIVDDEPAIRRFLRSILQGRRLEIIEAEDAVSALRLVKQLNGRVDLIVSDIRMPGDMNGVDLAYSVRNAYPAIPIILISGFSEEQCSGALDFCCVAKPFLPETLLQEVERALIPNQQGAVSNTANVD